MARARTRDCVSSKTQNGVPRLMVNMQELSRTFYSALQEVVLDAAINAGGGENGDGRRRVRWPVGH